MSDGTVGAAGTGETGGGRPGGLELWVRVAVGGVLVVASILAMGALTRFQYPASPEAAELRLAWRMTVPRSVECREPTAEELEELPIHMRQAEICEGRTVAYRLEVAVDGQVVHDAEIGASGARGDRPVYVFEAFRLAPGERDIRVRFVRMEEDGEQPAAEATRRGAPARLVFERTLELEARAVVLVTYDADARALVKVEG